MRRWALAFMLLITTGFTLADEQPGEQPMQRYIVVLHRDQRDAAAAVAAETRQLGGMVEHELGDRLVITASSGALGRLREHMAVRYVQTAALGQPIGQSGVLPEPAVEAYSVAPDLEPHVGQLWKSGDYSYDGSGNVTAIGSAAVPGTQGYRTYGYDSVGRLTQAQIGVTPSATYGYGYDAYGNRTSVTLNGQSLGSFPVSESTNRLTSATYDERGNQKTRGSTSATYDGFDMMTSYRFDAVNVETYVYTPADERIGVLSGDQWTWSIRDTSGKVLRQYQSSASNPAAPWLWVEDYVYRDGLLLGAERVAEEGGRRHFHLDHLGSPRLVTGALGSMIAERDFLPFGVERTSIGQDLARGFDREDPMRFTGHERDFDIDQPNDSSAYVDYMHARHYSPSLGRFFSPDPVLGNLLSPQSWNRYAYVINSPINFNDPYGLLLNGSYGGGGGGFGGGGATDGWDCHWIGDIWSCEITVPEPTPPPPQPEPPPPQTLLDWMSERWEAAGKIRNPVTGMTAAEHWKATGYGVMAFADGVVPFADPLEDYYNDGSVDGLEYSKKIGEYTRDLEIAIATAGGSMETRGGAEAGNWITNNVFRWGKGSWKNSGGQKWHFHLGPGKGVMRHHLPYQFQTWRHHAPQVIKRFLKNL